MPSAVSPFSMALGVLLGFMPISYDLNGWIAAALVAFGQAKQDV
jgi:hypothetical protein